MTPARDYRKPTARREQFSLRVDSTTLAFVDSLRAPGLMSAASRADAVIRLLNRFQDYVDYTWLKTRKELTVEDLWNIAAGLQRSTPISAWRYLVDLISDPDIEPQDPSAAATAAKVVGWEHGRRIVVITKIEMAIAAATNASPEHLVTVGAISNEALQKEFEKMLA